jgi:hypothetical protein
MSDVKSNPFDGHLDILKHFPPTFLTRELKDFIKAIYSQLDPLRVEADAVAATGSDDVKYLEMLKKADAWNQTLAVIAHHLKNFKVLAPMYRDLFRKLATAHEGLYHHIKCRRAFVVKITEREITNGQLEFIMEDFKRYEACLVDIRDSFKTKEAQLKRKFFELMKMGKDGLTESTSQAMEELSADARLLFASLFHATKRLIEELHSFDPELTEGIFFQVLETYPLAAKLSKLEEWAKFRKLGKPEEVSEVD